MLEIINCEQGGIEWFEARRGLITASEFSSVLAKAKKKGEKSVTRRKYMYTLAGERITGTLVEAYSNAFMQRGKDLEDRARELYQEQTGTEVTQIGFMKNGYTGYSPDGLIGNKRGIEIKVCIASIQIERLIADKVPSEYVAQVQGGNMVGELDEVDFVSYCEGMPLFIKRAKRDETYITNLKKETELFEKELQEIVNRIAGMY